jgi:hypothetical protein
MITTQETPAKAGLPVRRRLATMLGSALALCALAAPAAADGWQHRGELSKLEPGNLLVSERSPLPSS